MSGYDIGNIKGTKITLNQGYSDASGNSLICYHNNGGTTMVLIHILIFQALNILKQV